jgi:photosystem II stability/assembly factor-like uncharacterized protein
VYAAATPAPERPAANAYARKDEIHASSGSLNLPMLKAAHQAATWQITDAGNLQRSFDGGKTWESVSLNESAKLRVVHAIGFHIWVGGNGGVLFHSADGGAHFAAVPVRRKHAALTGDIVTLSFQDANHGRVEAANHEVWITTDGGGSWRRR